MASIIEAVDNTVKEAFAGIKVLVWAVPFCAAYSMNKSNPALSITIWIIASILFLGFLTESANNVIKRSGTILPGVNILKFGYIGLITSLVMAPYIAVSYFVMVLFNSFVKIPDPVWQQTAQIICLFLAITFTLASYVIYIRRLNPFDAYNMKKYFIGFGEVFLTFSFLIVKLALVSLVIIGFLAYVFSLFVGFQNVIWDYLITSVIVLYLVLAANYLAQISDEQFVFMEKKEAEAKEKSAINKL